MPTLVQSIHHVELYVANPLQAAHFYGAALGFRVTGRLKHEGTTPDRTSVLIERGDIRRLLTAPLSSSSAVAEHIRVHGEGIKDVAFLVTDVDAAFERATAHGAAAVQPPTASGDGRIRTATIGAFGEVVHSLIAGPGAAMSLLPSLVPQQPGSQPPDTGLQAIDHIAFALAGGALDVALAFYLDGLGFEPGHHEDITTEYSGMRSQVVQTPSGSVRFPHGARVRAAGLPN